ncbi:hypothetical protein HY988_05575 [Candidatus Micrarchaeota archaeon]|nr:hypothetical protein [Candidatus Micrarchaeota archaeon]
MQQFLEADQRSESDKPQIVIDQREDQLFDDYFQKYGAIVDRRVLSVGDFLCSSRLCIERKSRADFEQSVIDGRMFSQLPNLVANYERVVVIVEGVLDEERLSRSSLLGTYATLIADFGASLIFTRDKESTAELVYHFAKHEQLARKHPMRIYAKRKTFTISQNQRAIVESFPTVGPKSAKALLMHFGNLENLAKASENDIAAVNGIGKKKAKVISNVLLYAYDQDEDKFSEL